MVHRVRKHVTYTDEQVAAMTPLQRALAAYTKAVDTSPTRYKSCCGLTLTRQEFLETTQAITCMECMNG